ncbi:olfactory receptor 5G25-like [Gastrophryne carolinensis]
MYFFITQLSFLDIMLATDILPNFLHIVLYDGVTMSLAGCIIQFSIFGSSEISECLLLALMSYDRYLAICRPLHYNSIIDQVFCLKSVVSIWLLGFQFMLVDSVSICYLYFCGPNTINHFYCDLEPILDLACSDTTWIRGQTIVIAFICIIAPFAVITLSYVYIGVTIIKIPSVTGRQKAFTTCSSHLMGVSLFYGTLIAVYLSPTRGQFYVLSKVLSMFYTVITPMLNPVIYTFRNKDFKTALGQLKYRLGMQAITVLIRT